MYKFCTSFVIINTLVVGTCTNLTQPSSFCVRGVNNWYWNFRGFVSGYDDETRMLKFLILIEWPILLLIGGWLGSKFSKRYLTKNE